MGAYDKAGATSKMIAKTTEMPLRSVKRHLASLVREGVIQSPYRGQYVFVPGTPDILGDPEGVSGVHGLVLVTRKWPEGLRGPFFGPGRDRPSEAPDGSQYTQATEDWRGRMVRFRLYPDRTVVVYLAATRHPVPWAGEGGLAEFVGWLGGLFHPLDVGRAFEVVEIGINRDYEGWTLSGVKAVQLRHFGGAVERLYGKLAGVRHEVHLHPKSLELERAVRIISDGSPTRQLERALRDAVRLAEREDRERNRAQEAKTAGPPPIRPDSQSGYG